jgi:hypothetical protein
MCSDTARIEPVPAAAVSATVSFHVPVTGAASRPASGSASRQVPVNGASAEPTSAARGKNLEVFSPTIGRQLLELGLIDEIDLHIAPILLGDGIRLYANPASVPIRLHRLDTDDPVSVVNVRYRPAARMGA